MPATKYQAHEAAIRQFLADRGLLIKDLADKTGLSRKTLSIHINGEPMTWAVLSAVATALDVMPDAIAHPIAADEAVAG